MTSGRTLFVIDDDAALVESLAEVLSDEGYQVEGFTEPEVALARLYAGERPDGLLLDYVMPGMSGREFLARIEEARIEVPVLLLSGLSDPDVGGDTAVAVLPKPFDLDRLFLEISRLVGGQASRAGDGRP